MDSGTGVTILIPAAGRSSRFRALGFDLPKPVLRVIYQKQCRTMVGHVLAQIPRDYTVMIGLPAGIDLPDEERGPNVTVVSIVDSASHLDTVRQMVDLLPLHRSFVCIDCDTLFPVDVFLRDVAKKTGVDAVVGITENPDTGMARTGWVKGRLHYEEPPSTLPFGIVSARYFTRAMDFLAFARRAHTFSNVLNAAGETSTVRINHWLDWGTPEKLLKNKGMILP